MWLAAMTCIVMLAFAANSVLNRMAVGAGWIDPVLFAVVRLVSGAVMLSVLLALRRGVVWPGWRGRLPAVAGLLVYLFGFSAAYLSLDAGTGALILFGVVQVTMFAGALAGGEVVPARRILGALLALIGLAVLLVPQGGAVLPQVAMALAGVGWGSIRWPGGGRVMRWRPRRGTFCWRCRSGWSLCSCRPGIGRRGVWRWPCCLAGSRPGWAMRCGMRWCRSWVPRGRRWRS